MVSVETIKESAAIVHQMRRRTRPFSSTASANTRASEETHHERATQSRHRGHHVREPDGCRRFRVRRVRRARARASCMRCSQSSASPRWRGIKHEERSRCIARASAISWSTRNRVRSPPSSPPSTGPAPADSRSASASRPSGCASRRSKNGARADRATRKPPRPWTRRSSPASAAACCIWSIATATRASIYDGEFDYLPGVDRHPKGFGLTFIDHLTHNLYFGNMAKWADYYERLFNFREIRYFDIKGAKTGLVSKAMTAPDGMVRIPLNESSRSEVADQRIPRRSTTARASSTSPASPTRSTTRWRRCARPASNSSTRRKPISR